MRMLPFILISLLMGCAPKPDSPPTTPISKPALKEIDVHYGQYLNRLDVRIAITPNGRLRSVQTTNKSYGPGDIDPTNERFTILEGQLTPEQMVQLVRLFSDWESFSPQPYPSMPDGDNVSIRYGEKTISGGSGLPTQVKEIRTLIEQWASSMPVVPK